MEAVAEMACDWNAMGLEKGTDPLKWYEDNVARFSFPPHIDAQVRNFLNILRSK